MLKSDSEDTDKIMSLYFVKPRNLFDKCTADKRLLGGVPSFVFQITKTLSFGHPCAYPNLMADITSFIPCDRH